MERDMMHNLIEWKTKDNRKPLILWGARQVGKTWLMKEFARLHYTDSVYISFFNNKRMARIFYDDYNPKRIIKALEIELHITINPDETLIIFDEIQDEPKVLESLKSFCEDAAEYNIIAAGSLLGVSIHEGVSFPVGKVDELRLYPMSFKEYLWACGEKALADFIENGAVSEINSFADHYKELLKQYYCVGGMPEVVVNYLRTGSYAEARNTQLSILGQYEGDFGKHIKITELPRVRLVWNALPVQLSKENKKFFFGQVRKGARASEFELAIQWLVDAGLVYKVNKVSKPAVPLKAYTEPSAFKLFMVDIGLLCALSELDVNTVLSDNQLFVEFKGALAEQYVMQEIKCAGKYTPYYYSGEKSTYELDFLLQKNGGIMPLEVKAETNLKSKSLRMFCEKYKPKYAVRTSLSPYIEQEWMCNVPLWAVNMI